MPNPILDLTISMLHIPSTSNDIAKCREVIDLLHDYLGRAGHIVEYNGKPSLVVTNYDRQAEGRRSDIVLNGHIDVVPPTQDHQFEPYIGSGDESDKLYARGAFDMKSGVAVITQVMKDVLDTNYTNKKITLIINSDEEVGGFDGAGHLAEQGWGGDLVLVPDGGVLDTYVIAEKGIIFADVTFAGHATHSSRPRTGTNAIQLARDYYQELKQTIEQPDQLTAPDYWSSTVQMTMISGGHAKNAIPGECTASINIRFTEQWDEQRLATLMHDLAAQYNATVQIPISGAVLHSDASHPYIQHFDRIARAYVGDDLQLDRAHGASDGRFFAAKGSIVILHEATGKNAHGDDERVRISDLQKVYEIYKDVVRSDLPAVEEA